MLAFHRVCFKEQVVNTSRQTLQLVYLVGLNLQLQTQLIKLDWCFSRGTRGIHLYLDLDWADDGAAPGIDSVYLNTAFYPVFCISCWTRLIWLYRS